MPDEPNVLVIRGLYEAFARADARAVEALLEEDVEWRAGVGDLAGTYRGRNEVFGFLARLVERSGGTFRLEIDDVLGNERHVVALVREKGERSGRALDARAVHVWRVRDGKVVEFRGIPEDLQAVERFWS